MFVFVICVLSLVVCVCCRLLVCVCLLLGVIMYLLGVCLLLFECVCVGVVFAFVVDGVDVGLVVAV